MAKSREAFRTISEVADALGTQPHVLRFWESKFSQIKPVKRAGGRRYYRPADMALLGGIKQLLHEDGLTIKGVQKILRERGVKYVAALAEGAPMDVDAEAVAMDENVVPLRKAKPTKAREERAEEQAAIRDAELAEDDPMNDDAAQASLFDTVEETTGQEPEPTPETEPTEQPIEEIEPNSNGSILQDIMVLSRRAFAMQEVSGADLKTAFERLNQLRERMASNARG